MSDSADVPADAVDGRTARAAKRRRERRKQIVTHATRLIAKNGYANTSVADVIKAADVSRGTFYLYFESRDQLFDDILQAFIDALEETVEIISLEHEDPAGALYGNFRRLIDLLASNRDLTKVLFREAVGHSPSVDERVNAFYTHIRAMVSGALRKGVTRKLLRPVDESIISTAIVGCVKEVIYTYLVVGDGAIDPDTITTAIFDFGFNGLAAR